jgi:hypothetical protein
MRNLGLKVAFEVGVKQKSLFWLAFDALYPNHKREVSQKDCRKVQHSLSGFVMILAAFAKISPKPYFVSPSCHGLKPKLRDCILHCGKMNSLYCLLVLTRILFCQPLGSGQSKKVCK